MLHPVPVVHTAAFFNDANMCRQRGQHSSRLLASMSACSGPLGLIFPLTSAAQTLPGSVLCSRITVDKQAKETSASRYAC